MARRTSIEKMLVALYNAGSPFLQQYPWEFEMDRWKEFLVCCTAYGVDMPASTARIALDALESRNLLAARRLSSAKPKEIEAIRAVLIDNGCEPDRAAT